MEMGREMGGNDKKYEEISGNGTGNGRKCLTLTIFHCMYLFYVSYSELFDINSLGFLHDNHLVTYTSIYILIITNN